jgi:alkanesulfonate monooxygenase SsuD/methylene tetrahydromethanopterin reductase-like flavin-dependent oxidoreductase (luciferase family)
MNRLAIGAFLPGTGQGGTPAADVAAAARHAEDAGLESVWVVDQLVAGSGTPVADSGMTLAVAAAVTGRIRLGYGVMVVPLRATAWAAKQVATLQHLSGGRVLLGVGVGGDRHEAAWEAAGVPRRQRGRRLDAALAALPGLVTGRATPLDGDGVDVRLSPGAPMPPVLVGGASDAALRRAASHGAWFALPGPADALATGRARLRELAAERGRPAPAVTTGLLTALAGDPSVPDHDGLARLLTDPAGEFGMPAEAVGAVLADGPPAAVAARLADLADAGADRVVASFAAGDWHRQVDLLAEAAGLLDG